MEASTSRRGESVQSRTWAPDPPFAVQDAFGEEARSEVPVAVLAFELERSDRWARPAERAAVLEAVRERIAVWPGGAGWTLELREEVLWVFACGVAVKDSMPLARALVRAAGELRCAVGGRERRPVLRGGVAHSHHASRPSLAVCLLVAREGMRNASAGGVCLALHSTLYGGRPRRGLARPPAGAAASPEPEVVLRPAPPPVDPRVRELDELEETLLERRLGKVTAELERAEAELARLRGEQALDEHALPSGYREVQGLSPEAEHAERKRKLLARIYEANVELERLRRTRQ